MSAILGTTTTIPRELERVGVLLERWPASHQLPVDTASGQIDEAYSPRVCRSHEYLRICDA